MLPRLIHPPQWLCAAYRWASRPLYGGRTVDSVTVGTWVIMLIPFANTREYYGLLCHEAEHVGQAIKLRPQWNDRLGILLRLSILIGVARYSWRYLVEYMRHGYEDNAYEVAARKAQARGEALWSTQ